ncbi:MAG: phosphate ABC transporter substrate-binding protein [Acidobacteria bacterium]|nr:phosphate ABC transporter substrate-binding protein [Acidobacteriota bacterium]
MVRLWSRDAVWCLGVLLTMTTGCSAGRGQRAETLRVRGSDTMLILAQAWAESYAKVDAHAAIEVAGGGSGQGIAALLKGAIDIANCSRNIKSEEVAEARANTGKEPKEFVVGCDALAVFVHRDNPMDEITINQLAEIYRVGGSLNRWSQLGARIPAGRDRIVRVNRQSSSGTYEFFRDHVLGKRDFQLGSLDMNGSKEVVDLIASTPGAIGYSGMAFAAADVKMLRVSPAPGKPAYAPSAANVLASHYPISRSLLVYTLGEPEPAVQKYIDWMRSPEGQRIVSDIGYVPIALGGKLTANTCGGAGAN